MKALTVIRILGWLSLGLLCHGCSMLQQRSEPTDASADTADYYFDQGAWSKAITAYENYLLDHPDNHRVRIRLGQSYLAHGNTAMASDQFSRIIQSQSTFPPEAYFWAGRTSQMMDQFSTAEQNYRSYVESGESVNLEVVSYFLRQIGAAKKAGVAETRYLIENIGKNINSPLDEFRPIYSPNIDQRFYYSIHRPSAYPHRSIDPEQKSALRMAEIRQGFWTNLGPLDPDLTGEGEYQLLDFSKDGQKVLYSTTDADHSSTIYRKSFSSNQEEPAVSEWNHPVFDAALGDRDLFIIHDSAMLFSSHRLQGQGGYDIFVTYKRLGEWVAQNLGKEVNSPYDEVFPFLSNDGRELYFSSNSVQSIGGYDVFFATFDDDMESWSAPQKFLPPLNSGLNELAFRLSHDGSQALFVSDRSGGYGGLDIYQVDFDEPRPSQVKVSHPQIFYQVRAYRSFQSGESFSPDLTEKPVLPLPVISFGERPVVITPQIRSELDRVLEYCKLYPHTTLVLQIFSDHEVRDRFALYQPVLALQKILDYMEMGGLSPDRYHLRLYGNQYPRYNPRTFRDQGANDSAPVSSHRLEFDLVNTANLPVRFGVPVIPVQDEPALSPYQEWRSQTRRLYFRIKLVESDQLINGGEYYQVEDLMVLISDQGRKFTYYGGIYPSLEEAKKSRLSIQAKGFVNAEIVAFLGSLKISDDQINSTLIEEYPQLKEYIIYQK